MTKTRTEVDAEQFDGAELSDDAEHVDDAEPAGGSEGTPRWIPFAGLAVAVIGLGVAAYLTYAHFTNPLILACPASSVVNCEKVTTSAQSHIMGIPVAVLGLVFFFVAALVMLPVTWRSRSPLLRYGRLLFAITGVGMVIYLVYTELFTLSAICLWCTAVHILTLAFFALVVLGTLLADPT
jgi:uncharacterized membrane protein